MPIKDLTNRRRLPRLGKIHCGLKVRNEKGAEYPKATDYFVCPPEVQKVFGDKPKALRIMFPLEDDGVFASQFYRCYSQTRGLICKGDGETAMQLVDVATGSLSTHTSKVTELREVDCQGRDCPYYAKQCREMMMLQVMLPDVPGLGIYQLDTGSINSIININSAIELIRGAVGRISNVPLTLVLEPQEVSPDGKKKTVHVLNLRMDMKLSDLVRRKALPAPPAHLPEADDEAPELILPGLQLPKVEVQDPEAMKLVTKQKYPMHNLGDLFSACYKEYKMTIKDVLKELGITDKGAIADVEEAWQTIQTIKEQK